MEKAPSSTPSERPSEDRLNDVLDNIDEDVEATRDADETYFDLEAPQPDPDETEDEAVPTIEEYEQDAAGEERLRQEAALTLAGSQRIDQLVLQGADAALRVGEGVAAEVGKRKFALKDYYLQRRIDSVESKTERFERKANGAVLGIRRRRYAVKARHLKRQLEGLKQFQTSHRADYATATDTNPNTHGSRSERRQARAEQLQYRINRMIAAEYKFAQTGREARKQKKAEMKGVGNPAERERLRRLIVESGSVEKLEAVGRKLYIDKIMATPLIRDSVKAAAAHAMNQFDEATRRRAAEL